MSFYNRFKGEYEHTQKKNVQKLLWADKQFTITQMRSVEIKDFFKGFDIGADLYVTVGWSFQAS